MYYTSNPNQRNIHIHRNIPPKGASNYLCAYIDVIEEAARELNGEVPFKVYLYLLCNGDNFNVWFSPVVIAEKYGISTDRVRKSFKELEDKGYIVKTSSNKYEFHEKPQKTYAFNVPIAAEKRWVDGTDGERHLVTYKEFYEDVVGTATPDEITNYWNSCEKENEAYE